MTGPRNDSIQSTVICFTLLPLYCQESVLDFGTTSYSVVLAGYLVDVVDNLCLVVLYTL